MFGGIRQGNLFYIIDKSNLTLQIGEVVDVSNPKPKYQQGQFAAPFGQPETEIAIKVKVGDVVHEIEQLPTTLSSTIKNNVFVSDNKESTNAEIEAMLRSSRQAIEGITYHHKVVEACDIMLRDLNPQFAKEKEQEEKIGALESKIGDIDSKLNRMINLLSDSIEQGKPNKTDK